MNRKKTMVMLVLAIFMSVALYGCKGDKNVKNDDNSSIDGTVTSQEPTYGGSVVVGITQDLDSLDPHKAVAAGTSEVLYNVYEGLVKPDESGNILPAIASEYKVNEDGTVYTFTIRDDVKFHNGKAVTVDDVVYSVKRFSGMIEEVKAEINLKPALENIKDVKALDDKTVEITLTEADTELPCYLATVNTSIVPADYDELGTKPVGTGPFKFVSYSPLESFVATKNEGYWNKEAMPYLDGVTFKICANTDSAFVELQSGGIDIFPYLTEENAQQLEGIMNVEVGNMNLVQGLFLNNGKAPFDNPKVREALNYVIDKQQIIDMVAGGKGNVIQSNCFTGLTKYFNSDLNNLYSVDVEKAKELLKEAGYENGLKFTITVPSNYQFHVDTAQVIVEQLKAAGITAEINLVEWNTWLSDVYTDRNYEATIVGLDSNLSPRDLLERYNSKAGNNFVNYSNPEYDETIKAAIESTDDSIKVENYKKLQEILAKDNASVYIQDPALLVAMNKKLGGYKFYPVYVQDMSSIYFKK